MACVDCSIIVSSTSPSLLCPRPLYHPVLCSLPYVPASLFAKTTSTLWNDPVWYECQIGGII